MNATTMRADLAHLAIPVPDLPRFGWIADEVCDRGLIQPIRNINAVKPLGGLWVSPYIEDMPGTVWSTWLEHEGYGLISDRDAYVCQDVDLAINARILRIDTWTDFTEVLSAYLLISPLMEMLSECGIASQFFDFEAMAQDWDGVFLTDKGQVETRYGTCGSLRSPNLYGWDLESLLILNPEAIVNVGEPSRYPLIPVDDEWADWSDEDESETEVVG